MARKKYCDPHNDTQFLTVDTSEWDQLVKNLTAKEVYRSMQSGFRRAAVILRRGIQKQIKDNTSPHRTGVKVYTKRGWYYPKPIYKDVKISVFRSAIGANVSLCNPKNPDNRAYILRMLNAGASSRVTKKRQNRGSLRALNFFETGVNSAKERAIHEVDKQIKRSIMRYVDKYN